MPAQPGILRNPRGCKKRLFYGEICEVKKNRGETNWREAHTFVGATQSALRRPVIAEVWHTVQPVPKEGRSILIGVGRSRHQC